MWSQDSEFVLKFVEYRHFADTIWQDGSEQQNIPSVDLCPVMHMDEKEYFPGDFIVDKRGVFYNSFLLGC